MACHCASRVPRSAATMLCKWEPPRRDSRSASSHSSGTPFMPCTSGNIFTYGAAADASPLPTSWSRPSASSEAMSSAGMMSATALPSGDAAVADGVICSEDGMASRVSPALMPSGPATRLRPYPGSVSPLTTAVSMPFSLSHSWNAFRSSSVAQRTAARGARGWCVRLATSEESHVAGGASAVRSIEEWVGEISSSSSSHPATAPYASAAAPRARQRAPSARQCAARPTAVGLAFFPGSAAF